MSLSPLKVDKANITELTSINHQLKNQIKLLLTKTSSYFLSSSIDNTTNTNTNTTSTPITTNTDNSNKDTSQLISDLPYNQQLSIYQNSIDLARAKLKSYNYNQICSNEMQIKADEEILFNLKADHSTLLQQCNKNTHLLNSFSTLSRLKKDINSKKNQLKEIKEEMSILKQTHKQTEAQIKAQDKEMIALNDACMLMKDNIEYHIHNSNSKCSGSGSGIGDNDNKGADVNGELKQLTEKNNELQRDIEIERKEYMKEVNRQQTIIQELQSEVDYITLKLNKVNQMERITIMKDRNSKDLSYCRLTREKDREKSTPALVQFNGRLWQRSVTPIYNTRNRQRDKEIARMNKSNNNIIRTHHDSHSPLQKSYIQAKSSYLNSESNNNSVVIYKRIDSNSNYDLYKAGVSQSKIKPKRNFSFLNSYSKG